MTNKNFVRLDEQFYRLVCKMRGIECNFRPNAGSLTSVRVVLSDKEIEAIRAIKEGGEKEIFELEDIVISPIKRLFFDIETTPMVVYSWRIGSKINISYDNIIDSWKIITICYKWEDEEEVIL